MIKVLNHLWMMLGLALELPKTRIISGFFLYCAKDNIICYNFKEVFNI